MTVDRFGEGIQHGGVQFHTGLTDFGNIQPGGHAVGAGDFGKIMVEIFFSFPGIWVYEGEVHGRFLHFQR